MMHVYRPEHDGNNGNKDNNSNCSCDRQERDPRFDWGARAMLVENRPGWMKNIQLPKYNPSVWLRGTFTSLHACWFSFWEIYVKVNCSKRQTYLTTVAS